MTDSVTFTKTITGSSSGALTVASGQSVLITGSVSGSITVNSGGALEVDNGTVSGSVTATGAVGFTFCGATLSGALSVSKSTGYVLIGGGSGTGCTKSTISGSVTLSGNTAGVQVATNTISGVGFCRQQLRHRTDPAWGFGDRGDWQHHQRVAVLLDQHRGGDRQRDGQQGVQQERAVRRAS